MPRLTITLEKQLREYGDDFLNKVIECINRKKDEKFFLRGYSIELNNGEIVIKRQEIEQKTSLLPTQRLEEIQDLFPQDSIFTPMESESEKMVLNKLIKDSIQFVLTHPEY